MEQPTIIAVGELLVEFVSHRTGCELRELSEYSGPYPSGAPAICIEQAARIGANTRIFGGLGKDNFGRALIDRLRSSGVETSDVIHSEKSTGVAFVSYFDDGNRIFIFHLHNTAADAIADADFKLPSGAIILHVSGSSLGNPRLRVAIEKAATDTIARGGLISCDPNARSELMEDPAAREALLEIIQKSTYLFPSDSDLEFLFPGQSIDESVASLLNYRAETVALTRGDQGVVLFSNDESITLAGHSVKEVDPTGAGDCFCGTFLAMKSQGHSIEDCGRYANAAGAIAVTRRGPMEGNSDLTEIKAFMKTNPANTSDA